MKRCISLILALLTLCLICIPLTSCQKEREAQVYYEFFDTVSVIYSYENESDEIYARRCSAVESTLREYHKLFDIYYEYTNINNLCTVNKMAGIQPVKVDNKLLDFLEYCKDVYKLTNGKVNIASGAVLKLWHQARQAAITDPADAYLPKEDALVSANEHTDINNLIINRENSTVYLTDPQMSLDVGALGKGYATERAAEALTELGATSYALDIGGNLRLIGEKANDKDWTVGITDPDKTKSDFSAKIKISNTSCVTSGNYERFYTFNGINYHHIIDMDTLFPAAYHASVTVITQDSALGDCLSTALFCLSESDGIQLIKDLNTDAEVSVIWISQNGEKTSYGNIVFSN